MLGNTNRPLPVCELIVNAETRKLWQRTEYLPFYRTGEQAGASSQGGMLGFVSSIKQLRGGTGNLKSVLGNMIRNASMLVTEALKNEARAEVAHFGRHEPRRR